MHIGIIMHIGFKFEQNIRRKRMIKTRENLGSIDVMSISRSFFIPRLLTQSLKNLEQLLI